MVPRRSRTTVTTWWWARLRDRGTGNFEKFSREDFCFSDQKFAATSHTEAFPPRFCAPVRGSAPSGLRLAAAPAMRCSALQAGAAGPLARRPPPAAFRTDPQSAGTACPHSTPFSLAARGQSGACCTLLHLLFHRARHAPGQQCKQTAASRHSGKPILGCFAPRVGAGLRLKLAPEGRAILSRAA